MADVRVAEVNQACVSARGRVHKRVLVIRIGVQGHALCRIGQRCKRARGDLRLAFLRLDSRHGRVDQHTNHCGLRHYLAQEFQLLGFQVGAVIKGNAGDITSRPVES